VQTYDSRNFEFIVALDWTVPADQLVTSVSSEGQRSMRFTSKLHACIITFAACGAAACSSDSPTVRDELIGGWGTDVLDGAYLGFGFLDDGNFTSMLMDTSGSVIDMQIQVGSYELRDGESGVADDDGDYLFLENELSSCNASQIARAAGFSISLAGDMLMMHDATRTFVLDRVPETDDTSPGPTVRIGCFTNSGFVPRDFAPL
jgi:hypothetical protein